MNHDSLLGTGKRRVLFVLGSGVSLESGAPNVTELTKQILQADNQLLPKWFQKVGGDKEVYAIQQFLKLLIQEFERSGEVANYEDLFSMCQKLYEHEVGMSIDGTIIRFRDYIYRESAHLWRRYTDGGYLEEAPLGALSDKATILIDHCLKAILRSCDEPKGFELILETVMRLGADRVDILTLNHDTLIEAELKKAEIPYTCGFDSGLQQDGDVDFFDETAFVNSNNVRIIKLHGSWNWLRLGKNINANTTLWRWGMPNDEAECWDFLTDRDGERLFDSLLEKSTLTGTTTKTTAYTRGIFGELYMEARKILNQHDRIICSGYGWRDDGFNWMLKEWVESDSTREIFASS
ncbi:SIR2 family protein [Coraliomargarita algicola]|uniref:SIR2 family protein n=1 Tax=Coraliomargarita algicola TaxID=3092156 RepID=A0ABZ0RPI4_9BACT|nr:SIR2 family protein [Coraliomargarita sp. J2-16]WPJ97149.1 SIR2 family protein [Coraliomargarita sp. J2-16]